MISIIDIDSTIPNLALKKVEKYYSDMGEDVVWNNQLMASVSDKTYVSCIFTENKWECGEWEGRADIGGSGYSLTAELPPEIDVVKPRINIGFTTRGCIRKCEFCIVPEKEGGVRIEDDIYGIWDGESRALTLLDNNILALPDHFSLIASQLKKEKLSVDFNQGLDHRLVDDGIAKELLSLRHTAEIRFAYDYPSYKSSVLKCIKTMRKHGLKDWGSRWYVYVSESDTYDTVYERMAVLHEQKQMCYVMRDRLIHKKPEFILLAKWGNHLGAFKYDLDWLVDNYKEMTMYKNVYEANL